MEVYLILYLSCEAPIYTGNPLLSLTSHNRKAGRLVLVLSVWPLLGARMCKKLTNSSYYRKIEQL